MATPSASATRAVRFATFELDLETGELRNRGIKIKVEGQPLRLLEVLLEHPGELVTREVLQQRLWPTDTFVDFEHSINVAVKRLRDVLGDSASTPRFIETLPRRGYRFIYPLDADGAAVTETVPHGHSYAVAAAVVVFVTLIMALAGNVGGLRDRIFGRATGEITSVAVLPLKNLSADPEQEYFADGMTEMLITELGRVSALRVPSHQSVMKYAKTALSAQEIAQELQVDSVIEGTVMRDGDRVRITINFIQVRPERHLVAEKYDRDIGEIFMVHDDVAQRVLHSIRATLTSDQRRHFARSRHIDSEVNEAYLKGLFHAQRGTNSDRAKAYAYFARAVEKDANFAPAYGAMALLDAHGGGYRGEEANAAFFAQARQRAMQALDLDDTLAEAHTALAWLAFAAWRFEEADREFKRAIELNPNLPVARVWYLPYLTALGRNSEAEPQARAALLLAPVSVEVLAHVSNFYIASGRFDDAIDVCRKVVDLDPDYFIAHSSLGRAYLVKGMYQDAIDEFDKATAAGTGGRLQRRFQEQAWRAYAYAKLGRQQEAMEIIRTLVQKHQSPAFIAIAYIGVGDKDNAFTWLEKAYENHQAGGLGGFYVVALYSEPLFASLRDDPRFAGLAARIGLPPFNAISRN